MPDEEHERHFTITTPRYEYHATIATTEYASNVHRTLRLSAKNAGSVVLSFDEHPAVRMVGVDFPPGFGTHGHFGEDTKYMVALAMRLVQDNAFFGHGCDFGPEKRREFELTDDGCFSCDDESVSLAHTSVLLYSQTWYEHHFGAKLVNKQLKARYDDTLGLFRDPTRKKPFEAFIYTYGIWMDKTKLDIFEKLYELSPTYSRGHFKMGHPDLRNKNT